MQKLLLLSILFFILISKLVLSAEVYPFICPDDSFQALEDFVNIAAEGQMQAKHTNASATADVLRKAQNNIGAIQTAMRKNEVSTQKNNISERTEEKLQQAQGEHKLYLATYTFTSYPLAYDLVELKKSGADVKVMIDNYPVGGIPDKKILCFLEENNISVFLYQEPYKYMHAKYIIKDNSELLITTENFGESGFPSDISALNNNELAHGQSAQKISALNNNELTQGQSAQKGNRGWGAIIEDPKTSLEFLEIFKIDASNSKLFKCDLNNKGELSKPRLQQTQSEHIEFKKYTNQNIKVFFAPDNALDSILELINSTKDFIYVEQFYIYKYWGSKKQQKPNQFLEALINKARHGAEVKILMDSSYYNILETSPNSNYNTMIYINEIAENESLNLQAKLIDLKSLNLEKLHAKVLVAGNSAMISSVNWNENSPKNNRESGVIITGDSSLFYKQAFLKDWSTGKLTELSPTGLFISSPNLDIYIFICIVSFAGFLAWVKKRKK